MTIRNASRNTVASLLAAVMLMATPVQTLADMAEQDLHNIDVEAVQEVASDTLYSGVYGEDMFAYVVLQPGDSGNEVKTVQRRLGDLGYFSNSVTGNYGTMTTEAVKAFQRKCGIVADGMMNQETYELLFSENAPRADAAVTAAPTEQVTNAPAQTEQPANDSNVSGEIPDFTGVLKNGSTGAAVKQAQQRLKDLGYLSGTCDGAFGNATLLSVKAFQTKCGDISVDGTINFETHLRLYASSAPAASGSSPTATPAPTATAPTSPSYSGDIKYGSTGTAVKNVQKRLIELGYLSGSADGAFGNATLIAVKAFQSAKGLSVTGIVNQSTFNALFYSNDTPSDENDDEFVELSKGMSGDAVKAMQARLKELGFYNGSLMGNFGELTQTALYDFQKAAGLAQTGILDKATNAALYSSDAPYRDEDPTDYTELKQGDSGNDVKSLQTRLIQLGYLSGSADGSFGSSTVTAIKAFQTNNGLTVNGIATVNTQQKLFASTAIPAPTQTPSATSTPSPTPATTEYATLKSGSVGAAVKALQNRLAVLGYLADKADGAYGANTCDAVKTFQIKLGLEATGVADNRTQIELYRSDAPRKDSATQVTPMPTNTATADPSSTPTTGYATLKTGSTGEAVKALQQKLAELGYYTGSINSTYDSATLEAVRSFQSANSLSCDGVAGSATQTRLFSGDALSKDEAGDSAKVESNTPVEVSGSVKKPVIGEVIEMDWFQNLDGFFNRTSGTFKIGATAVVTDVKTGICYTVRRLGGTNHADVEPLTAFDAWQMYRIYGKSWSWTRHAAIVTVGGKNIAASINGMPHGGESITNNNFVGHSCIHFTNSRTHGSNRVDPDHQAAIKTALAADVSAINSRIQAQ